METRKRKYVKMPWCLEHGLQPPTHFKQIGVKCVKMNTKVVPYRVYSAAEYTFPASLLFFSWVGTDAHYWCLRIKFRIKLEIAFLIYTISTIFVYIKLKNQSRFTVFIKIK